MSIFDQTRNILKDLQSKATSPVNSIGQSRPNIPQAQPINWGQVANNVSNFGKPLVQRVFQTKSIPITSLIPQAQMLNSFSPKVSPQQLFNQAAPTLQAAPRRLLQLGQSRPMIGLNLPTNFNFPQIQPQGRLQQAILGKTPIQDVPTDIGNISKYTQSKGLPKPLAMTSAPLLFGVAAIGDILPGGGAKKQGVQEVVGLLANRSKNAKEFSILLGQTKPEIKQAILKIFDDPLNPINNVLDLYNKAKGIKPVIPPVIPKTSGQLFQQNLLNSKKDVIEGYVKDPKSNRFTLDALAESVKETGTKIKKTLKDQSGFARLDLGLTGGKTEGLKTKVGQDVSSKGIIPHQAQKYVDEYNNLKQSVDNWQSIKAKEGKLSPLFEQEMQGKLNRMAQIEKGAFTGSQDIKPFLKAGDINAGLYDTGKTTLFRGESQVNNSGGRYYSTDKNWASQFTQRGTPNEVKSITFNNSDIYKASKLPNATNVDEMNNAIREAQGKNFKAILVDEGKGEPNSVFMVKDYKVPPASNIQDEIAKQIKANENYKSLTGEDSSIMMRKIKELQSQLPQSRVAQPTIADATQTANELAQKAQQTLKPSGELPVSDISPETPPNNQSSSSLPPIISDPVQKIVQALKEAKPIRAEQEALYSKARAEKVARATAMGQKVSGEQGYFAQLGQLKGELPKAQFEGIRAKLTSEDINSVFQKVEDVPYFSTFEKITAKTGLSKLLGKEGGVVPNKSELSLLNEVFPPEFIQAAQGNRTGLQKLLSGIGQIVAVPRSLMAGGFDMSYGLRQGVFSGYSHPKQFAAAFKDQFKNFASEKAYQAGMDAIKADTYYYKLSREAGVSLTDLGKGVGKREEPFQSQLAERIPGVGHFIRASGRAYTGFANKYRFDIFKSLVQSAKQTGDFKDPKFLKNAGEFINTVTGRGSLGKFEKQAGVLSSTLFSPRLLASRLQLMNPQFYMKLHPAVRKEALKSLIGYVAGTATILGVAKMAGADVGTDPTSSDFAKIKVGNTRIDIMGGFQQPIVLLSRLLTGKMTSSTTGKTMILGEGYKTANRFDIVQRFFESKEAPIVSFIVSAMKGQDAIGNKFNLPTEVINRMVPMFIADMVDLYKDGGLSSLPLGLPAFFGAGAQTYGKTEMITGKNQLGESTSQIRPIQGIGESVTEKVFGKQPLGSSSTTNVSAYYDQLKAMPKDQANAKYFEIVKTNPDLAKKLVQVAKDRRMGITVDDQVLKAKGVASGDRAKAMADEFNKLKTREEKIALYDHYVKIGAINPEIYRQLKLILKK